MEEDFINMLSSPVGNRSEGQMITQYYDGRVVHNQCNHIYQREQTSESDVGQQMIKTRDLATTLGLSKSDEDRIVSISKEEFRELGREYDLSQQQIVILRDIRKRGKSVM